MRAKKHGMARSSRVRPSDVRGMLHTYSIEMLLRLQDAELIEVSKNQLLEKLDSLPLEEVEQLARAAQPRLKNAALKYLQASSRASDQESHKELAQKYRNTSLCQLFALLQDQKTSSANQRALQKIYEERALGELKSKSTLELQEIAHQGYKQWPRQLVDLVLGGRSVSPGQKDSDWWREQT